jgi:hypothetical protein
MMEIGPMSMPNIRPNINLSLKYQKSGVEFRRILPIEVKKFDIWVVL